MLILSICQTVRLLMAVSGRTSVHARGHAFRQFNSPPCRLLGSQVFEEDRQTDPAPPTGSVVTWIQHIHVFKWMIFYHPTTHKLGT